MQSLHGTWSGFNMYTGDTCMQASYEVGLVKILSSCKSFHELAFFYGISVHIAVKHKSIRACIL